MSHISNKILLTAAAAVLFAAFAPGLHAQRDLENISSEEDLKQYIYALAPSENAFVAVQMLAARYIDNKEWGAASRIFRNYQEWFPEMWARFDLIIELLNAPSENLTLTNLEQINTGADEYFPVVTIDGKRMYFTGSGRNDCIKGEDIFYSDFLDSTWKKPRNMGHPFSTKGNDAINSVSPDGTMLVLFGNYKGALGGGDNFYLERTSTGWSGIKPFPRPVNSRYWDCDGFLTADGKAFLFTSDRKGGIGEFRKGGSFYHGGYEGNTDIYVSLKKDSGWTRPVNLGPGINTPYAERSPFLHPDGKTLYFSSDGHYGLGSLDVFKTVRQSDTSWTQWSEPVNLGKEINTSGFDVAYKISTDGELAYFSSDKPGGKGGYDIYSIKLPDAAKPTRNVVSVKGKVTDENLSPLEAEVKWYDLKTNENIGSLRSDPETGDYLITLPVGSNYSYFAEKEGYYSTSNNINLTEVKNFSEMTVDIVLASIRSLEDKSIRVNNIYFDFDSYELRPESFPELERLHKFLGANRGVKIEISAHTDSKGSDEYNLQLSQQRASSVVDFLIMKGIDQNNLVAVGYGEQYPVGDNETEDGRAMNRRVEMRIIK